MSSPSAQHAQKMGLLSFMLCLHFFSTFVPAVFPPFLLSDIFFLCESFLYKAQGIP